MPFLDPGATCVGTVETGPWRRAPNMVARRAKRSKVVRMLLTSAFGEPHWDKIKASGPRPKHLGKSLPKYHPYDGTVWIFMVKCGYNIHGMLWVWEVQEALESNNIFFWQRSFKDVFTSTRGTFPCLSFCFCFEPCGTGTTITREISSQVAPQTLEPPHTAMNLQCQCLVQPPNHM